jgi:HEAT repeat protein
MRTELIILCFLFASCASQQRQDTIADKVHRLGQTIATETDKSPDCWTQAHHDLKKLGAEAVPHIRHLLLNAESARLRVVCAKILASMKAREGIPDLIKALKDPDRDVRIGSLRALHIFRDSSDLNAMLRCFTDADEKVRTYACIYMAPFQDKRVLEALHKALGDPVFKVRFWAAVALTDKGNADGIKVLIEALKRNYSGLWIPVICLEKLTGIKLGVPGDKLIAMEMSSDSKVVRRLETLEQDTTTKWLAWWKETGRNRFGD